MGVGGRNIGVVVGCGVAVGGKTTGVGVGNGVGKTTGVGVNGSTIGVAVGWAVAMGWEVAVGAGVMVGIDANAEDTSSCTIRRMSLSDGTHAAAKIKIPATWANWTNFIRAAIVAPIYWFLYWLLAGH